MDSGSGRHNLKIMSCDEWKIEAYEERLRVWFRYELMGGLDC